MSRYRFFALGSALCVLSGILVADPYHYNNLLVGGKAIGYGGAYVALANDQSAMHYNAAGLAFQEDSTSASVNTMAFENTRFENVYTDGSDFERKSFTVVPGFIGISGNTGNWSYGTYFTVTDFSQERNDSRSTYEIPSDGVMVSQSVVEMATYDFDNAVYKFGFAGAYQLDPALSFGLSLNLKYVERVLAQTSGAGINFNYPEMPVSSGFDASRRINEEQYLLQPAVSVLYRGDKVNLGAQYTYTHTVNRQFEDISIISAPIVTLITGSPNTSFASFLDSDQKQKQPSQFSFGAAYKGNRWTLSGQVDYFTHVDGETAPENVIAVTRELKEVTNYALGLRVMISDDSALQLGVFTDNSNGQIDTRIPFQRVEDIDTTGISIAYESTVFEHPLTVGLYYRRGDGKVRYADVRFVESVIGVDLYPQNAVDDIQDATKSSLVVFASMDF